jgi:drug/metabolite transporter (DMT)-like permease
MPQYIEPFGFIVLRVGGSVILFWIVSLFIPKEKIDLADFPRIIAAALFGVALNMLTFFKGLSYTSPIMGAVLMVTTPMIVLILSAFIMRERMKKRKVLGIVLGLAGTISLILYGKSMINAPNEMLGNLLVFINAVSYGFYLILVKKLMDKYNAFTFVKWIYTFGFIMVLPYLLNLVSMRELKPTTVAVFIYLQPLFATIFAISLGKDDLSWVKIGSAVLIFTGVYLVTQKKSVQ